MLDANTIQTIAKEAGFDACGTVKAERLEREAAYMEEWLKAGLNGNLDYLERNRELRYDPRQLVPNSQTIIVVLLTYEHSGRDYHRTIKSLLYELKARLEAYAKEHGEELKVADSQHIFCDSAPMLERSWAVRAGLGFIGRNRQLIHPILGSKVHIGELVINNRIEGKEPVIIENGCGDCRLCIEACPGQALGQEQWDARKCIAYVTHKCIVCQEACPYNQRKEQDNIQ